MLEKYNSFKILKLFFENPEKKFYIREIARITKLSPPGVMKITDALVKEGLLLSEKGKVTTNIMASRSEEFTQTKRFFNLLSLYKCGLVSFLRENYEEPEAIVLFGSYSKGEDISTSDIDVAVVTSSSKELDLKKFENALKRGINVHEIKVKNAEKSFLNALSNGLVLYGYLKVL